ncbi:hypothetical protein GPECTOR_10g1139 [Gonium pectorale]|uniref:Helicase ATP-binding domain-containing protein n=1 Tax=Gonium pectorale TaxID=33097 RepID=A0A150GQH1_GONPE|nr:hypothetical protein GPECTOR_10g1139 [Gonium pectorale]|eukprot:KXZ52116.1 hypothetical protein GPECTOR_10g1139 [Gonium pectorale]
MMEDEIGLAELGVRACYAAAVEDEVIKEALDAAAELSGEGTGAGDAGGSDHGRAEGGRGAEAGVCSEEAGGDGGRRELERGRTAAKLASVESEIAAMEAALAAAEEEQALTEAGELPGPGGDASNLGLQLAVMRDRLSGLRAERQRLHRLRGQQQQGAATGAAAAASGSAPTAPGRPRFGARALARKGASASATVATAATVVAPAPAAAGGEVLTADGGGSAPAGPSSRKPPPLADWQGTAAPSQPSEGRQRPAKKARMQPPTAAASAGAELNGGDGDVDGDEAGDGEGAPGGPGGLALAETEKDRLIRRGLLTPFDRLAGFERKVQNAPTAAPPAAGPGDSGGGGGSGGSGCGGPSGAGRFQATGFGSLRHLGRAELRPEEAAATSTRSGRPVGEVIEEAGRQALEARAARRTAKFMELEQLPQQERDVRRVAPHFWHQAATGRKAGRSKGLRGKSTLPRAKPAGHRRPRPGTGRRRGAADGDEEGREDEAGQGSEEPAEKRRRRRSRRRAGDGDDDGSPPASPPSSSDAPDDDGDLDYNSSDGSDGSGSAGSSGESLSADASDGDAADDAGYDDADEERRGAADGDEEGREDEAGQGSEEPGEKRRRRRSRRRAGDGDDDGSPPASPPSSSDAPDDDGDLDYNSSDGSDGSGSAGSSGESLSADASDGDAADDAGYDDADEEFYQQRLERLRRSAADAAGPSGRRRSGSEQPGRRRRRRRRRSGSVGAGADGADGYRGAYGTAADGRAAEEAELQDSDAEGPGAEPDPEPDEPEPDPDPDADEDVVFEGGFRVPARLYGRLFDYQRTAVKWLWELHTQQAGGILGDEMGLGKTVQIIAYLAGLHHSGLFRPSLVVCPATVLSQWLRELRAWAPELRVVVLHDSGRNPPQGAPRPGRAELLDTVLSSPAGVLLTTYEQLRLQRALLLRPRWGVAVLDEGHKIRNPDSEITLVCKQLHTVHRLIVSGSPIQNRLSELWSLFDFIFPGKLGTLPVFTAQFAVPIQVGTGAPGGR